MESRASLGPALGVAIETARKSRGPLALLRLDLHRFRVAHDLFGPETSDRLLTEAASRLRRVFGSGATLARTGGAEFAVVVSRDAPGAARLGQDAITAIEAPFPVEDGAAMRLGASVGLAVAPDHGTTPSDLLRHADIALADGKRTARGHVRVFTPEMDARLRERRAIDRGLQAAIGEDRLRLVYQPYFAPADGRVLGFEALLRWPHPERGEIGAAEFIGVAEESGAIVPLSAWVLDRACAEACAWPEPCRLAVNVSAAQFRSGDLADAVTRVLARTRLPPSRLEIEVTESVLIEDAARARAAFQALRAIGARLVLDDFGTGHANLTMLRDYPFDKVKIDQSFVAGLGHDPSAPALLRAVIALGRGLGLRVAVEGVETQAQHDVLRGEDCDELQGFLLGRPMPAEAARAMLLARASGGI